MLRRATDVMDFTLAARDGELGRVIDFYFDDQSWTIRYLVADTGKWLALKSVLISPFAVRQFHDPEKAVEVDLTRDQVKNSPSVDMDAPVSRQYEREYYKYYGWPYYWQGSALWGPAAVPVFQPGAGAPAEGPDIALSEQGGDPHLRSVEDVTGYYLQARDGEVGHVEDFVFEDEGWSIHYLVVDTRNWWPGKRVLVSPAWATSVDWDRSKVHVNLERGTIQGAPEYNPSAPITREYEARLHDYYNRPPYWEGRLAA